MPDTALACLAAPSLSKTACSLSACSSKTSVNVTFGLTFLYAGKSCFCHRSRMLTSPPTYRLMSPLAAAAAGAVVGAAAGALVGAAGGAVVGAAAGLGGCVGAAAGGALVAAGAVLLPLGL